MRAAVWDLLWLQRRYEKKLFNRRGQNSTDSRVKRMWFHRRGAAAFLRMILPTRVKVRFTDVFTDVGKFIPIVGNSLPMPRSYRRCELALAVFCARRKKHTDASGYFSQHVTDLRVTY